MLKLDVMIATIRPDGIERVARMYLPRVEGVHYVVAWQMPGGAKVPESLASRDDVSVHPHDSVGLARNRNHALACTRPEAEIGLVADDDLTYTEEGLRKVISAFETHPEIDLALFKYDGATAKVYPRIETELSLPLPVKGWYLTEVEMAFRLPKVRGSFGFDEQTGLGAPYIQAGEGELFLTRALRMAGLKGRFFPETIVSHPAMTTGSGATLRPGVVRGRGMFRFLHYPLSWPARIIVDAVRDSRNGRLSLLCSLRASAQGALYAIRHLHKDGTRK